MTELTLATDQAVLVILPDHGGDLHSLTHRGTGVDVLYKPHWTPSGTPALGKGRAEWLADYRGGWQVLLPNAGDQCERHGRLWGFHGEASTVPWQVEAADPAHATMSINLNTAPLRVRRLLRLTSSTLRVDETITNLTDDTVEVMYVHHLAFGAPLVASGALLDTGARTVIADPEASDVAVPGTTSSWPRLSNGVNLREVPTGPRALMAYLTDFTEPYYAITNPALRLGVAVRWTPEPLPHAWLWQEIRCTRDEPWAGRACAMAVEPASTFPGHGLNYVNDKGGTGLLLLEHDEVTASVETILFVPPPDATGVVGVGRGGNIRFGDDHE